ncbi:MAG: sulfatase-like hydrolase/transferase, partial [Opitutales bacterium]
MKQPLRILAVSLAAISLLSPLTRAQNATSERPNIIFFISDDMLPQHFNCLPQGKGKNLTPNLDRLAREGTLMMGQHVVSPVCTPSRYNVLTGKFGSRAQNPWFK